MWCPGNAYYERAKRLTNELNYRSTNRLHKTHFGNKSQMNPVAADKLRSDPWTRILHAKGRGLGLYPPGAINTWITG